MPDSGEAGCREKHSSKQEPRISFTKLHQSGIPKFRYFVIMSNFDYQLLEQEVQYKFARSSGKGGQHVNKTETKVVLLFDIQNSAVFNAVQKKRLMGKIRNRINQDGYLVITSEKHRSQHLNKKEAFEKLVQVLKDGLKVKVKRKKTTISALEKAKRLKAKKMQSEKKKLRQKPNFD